MGWMELLAGASGLAKGRTEQRGGRRFRARNSDRDGGRPIAGKGGRESGRKARGSAAAGRPSASAAKWLARGPPWKRGAGVFVLSGSLGSVSRGPILQNMRNLAFAPSKNPRKRDVFSTTA